MTVAQGDRTYDAYAGITVEHALQLPCLEGARLVAGESGKDRVIRVVNIMEVPDIVRWMRGGEFLLTTGHPVRDDPDKLSDLVPRLNERGLAALGVKVGPYLPALPSQMLAAADDLGFPVVELPGELMFNDVLADVIGTVLNRQAVELEQSRRIHEQLTAVTLTGGSYQEITTTLYALTECPAAVRDDQGWVIASAGSPDVEHPPAATRTIKVGGTDWGQVSLWAGRREVADYDLVALEHATTVAATVTAQERAMAVREQRYRALMLTELTSRQPRDRAEMSRRAAAMGWDLHVPRAAVLLEVADEHGRLLPAERATEDNLSMLVRASVGTDAIAWGVQSGLAMLVEEGRSLRGTCAGVHRAVSAAHPRWAVMVAAGTVYQDFADFHVSYQEAVETLTLGRELRGTDFVLQYDELGIYRLLNQLPPSALESLVQECLGGLLEYDRKHKGSLMESLAVYLRHNRNGVEAAAELHVHYNTLRYRLDKIDQLTSGLERHPTSRLQIELAVHARTLLAARAGD